MLKNVKFYQKKKSTRFLRCISGLSWRYLIKSAYLTTESKTIYYWWIRRKRVGCPSLCYLLQSNRNFWLVIGDGSRCEQMYIRWMAASSNSNRFKVALLCLEIVIATYHQFKFSYIKRKCFTYGCQRGV